MDNIPILEHKGRTYSGHFRVIGDVVEVFHHRIPKRADLGGLPASSLARQLLHEIVVREGRGTPDKQPLSE